MLLDAHPNVVVPPECQVIFRLQKKYGRFSHFDKDLILSFYNDLLDLRYFDKWTIDRDELKDKLLAMEGETSFNDLVRAVYLTYSSFFKKEKIRLIGDKNPGYSLFIKKIFSLYPESKFIHIVRDYRDNYLSLINAHFEIPVVPLVVFRWKFTIKLINKLKKRHPESFYTLRYEDLAANPEKYTRNVCAFLGIEFDASVLGYFEQKGRFMDTYGNSGELMKIHDSLMKPISTGRINLWEKQMPERDIKIADLVAGKYAGSFGYQRKYDRFNLGLYLWILPTLIYGQIMYNMVLFAEKLPHSFGSILAEFLAIFKKIYMLTHNKKIKQDKA
jgi:hypothetical protein